MDPLSRLGKEGIDALTARSQRAVAVVGKEELRPLAVGDFNIDGDVVPKEGVGDLELRRDEREQSTAEALATVTGDGAVGQRGGTAQEEEAVATIAGDDAVADGGTAGDAVDPRAVERIVAVGDHETGQVCSAVFAVIKGDDCPRTAPVDDGVGARFAQTAGAGNRDGLALEVDLFRVPPGCYDAAALNTDSFNRLQASLGSLLVVMWAPTAMVVAPNA